MLNEISLTMQMQAQTPEDYIAKLPDDRQEVMINLRKIILQNLPKGFEECISYGMIGYVVPKSLYPDGYHCNAELPLPFINLASQKNYIALYHLCIYANEDLMKWFKTEYPKHSKYKLDMGKSCIRFKRMNDIPYELIGELCSKITPQKWIDIYETNIKR
jgi:uncharacterized protein YdhG (YjbR/CyaY superfamily)